MKTALDGGLLPGESLEIIFTPEDQAKYRIKSRRTVTRFVKRYLAEHKLSYESWSFTKCGNHFIVVHRPRTEEVTEPGVLELMNREDVDLLKARDKVSLKRGETGSPSRQRAGKSLR